MSQHSPELPQSGLALEPLALPLAAPQLDPPLRPGSLPRADARRLQEFLRRLPAVAVRCARPRRPRMPCCRLADDAIDLGVDPHAAMRDLQARLDAIAPDALAAWMPTAPWPRWCTATACRAHCWMHCWTGSCWMHRPPLRNLGRAVVLRRARGRHGGRDDGAHHGRQRTRRPWRAPASSAWPCSSTNIARDVGEDARNGRARYSARLVSRPGHGRRAPAGSAPVRRAAHRTLYPALALERADALDQRGEAGIARPGRWHRRARDPGRPFGARRNRQAAGA